MRFAIYTNAYSRALRENDALATIRSAAMRKLTVAPEVPVPSQPARDIRQFERMFGHVFIDGPVMRFIDEDAKEGTYTSKVAGVWWDTLAVAVKGKELQYPVYLVNKPTYEPDGYYVVRNGDGDTLQIYNYLIEALYTIYHENWAFWLRDFENS